MLDLVSRSNENEVLVLLLMIQSVTLLVAPPVFVVLAG